MPAISRKANAYEYPRVDITVDASKLRGASGVLTSPHPPFSLAEMEALHAPWRIEYILAPKEKATGGSIFTRIAQSSDDEANYVIARDRTCFAILNSFPYTGGHLMVVPYKQVPDFYDLTDEEMTDLLRLLRRCQAALTKVMKPDGFNVGANLGRVAGAGIVEHLHIHVVPRWNGDTNFMAVIANTSVVPEALREVAAKLRTALNSDR
jgi:ATP adenylyltransferase